MIAISFIDVLIDFGTLVGFCLLVIGACAALWALAYWAGDWSNSYNSSWNKVRGFGAVLWAILVAIPIGAFFIVWGVAIWGDETPDTFSTSGGQGPDTVCWYALVDDDKVVGKVVVDDEEIRTICAKTPLAVPDEVKTGEK